MTTLQTAPAPVGERPPVPASSQRRPGVSLLRRARMAGLVGGLGLALVAAAVLSVAVGAVHVRPVQVVAILAQRLGVDIGVGYTAQQEAVVWAIRLPRVLLGVLVGAGLASAGAALQGIFRNPLADPGVIGVSSGAALGAVFAIVMGIASLGQAALPVAAFAGGLVATLVVYGLSRHQGRTEVVTLVLTGVAVNAIAGAGIGLLTFLASDAQLRSLVFWSMGSLGGATWGVLGAAAPFVLAGVVLLPRFARSLDLLVLGEREAAHLGVATERVRVGVILLAAMTTGAAVAAAGVVGFIGLVVPHLVRLVAGPSHRVVLVASAIGGGIVVVGADLASRTLAVPAELPLGVLTGAMGGPFFLWLLHRARREQGGWG